MSTNQADVAENGDSLLTLNDVGPGSVCTVRSLRNHGAIRQRLLDMGVVPKAEISVIRCAPLKDPIEIRIGDTFIALRRAEAKYVEVAHV